MNGLHDCGGMDYLGPIEIEADEPVFHAEWEGRVFGLLLAIGMNGFYNLDDFRHSSENRTPSDYLNIPYFEKWLSNYEMLLAKKGIVTQQELLDARKLKDAKLPKGASPALPRTMVAAVLAGGGSARRDIGAEPRFRLGDQVVTRNINIPGHTRLPRYARCKTGVVVQDRGIFTFNDSMANLGEERPQHIYSIRFTARELWGMDASERDTSFLDLWDDHLGPATKVEGAA
ncbi:nitrile hydratase subunit beta [Mesorhizobium cantuariense]|uniref:Nitrile hydratase subunit beta n=1 Tax=Mesorhizobium cantuariense TaxID=1300275 RepID=A0ABV7MP62_9HYPH